MNIYNKTYFAILLIFFSLFFLFNFYSCDDGPSAPRNNEIPSFTWVVDTISYPGSFQTLMYTIWGNSEEDLYIAGHNNRGLGKAFHYNGTEWLSFLPIVPIGFNTYNFASSRSIGDVTLLFGSALFFSDDTIVNISDSSLILSYASDNWSVSKLGGGEPIESISGSFSEKLYAVGRNLTFLEFNNNEWHKKPDILPIPKFFETKTITDILVDQFENTFMLVFCYNGDPHIRKNYFLKEVNSQWIIEDSLDSILEYPSYGSKFLEDRKNNAIYSYNPGIYLYNNSSWSSIWENNELITTIELTEDGNIFAAGYSLYYYNGANWIEYEFFRDKFGLARDILILQDKIVVLFSNSKESFVIWGDK